MILMRGLVRTDGRTMLKNKNAKSKMKKKLRKEVCLKSTTRCLVTTLK
jgi:hypothetical protein